MIIKFNLKKLLISLAIPLVAGGISTLITAKDMKIYNDIVRPPLSPPMILFPIVWCILYILMGISLYLVWNSDADLYLKKKGYWIFAIQLILNFIWSPIFFTGRQFLLAFIVLIAMWVLVLCMIIVFSKIKKCAGLLQIPYLIWLTIAAYLNLGIYILN
ncbi:MAG: tryptophan-rich sensory protein [Clostridia bacterium]|nr:tryptophan-rich sensory protein [Clostridia bacterium]